MIYYRAGFFAEILVGESTFLTASVTRNMASPALNLRQIEYNVNDNPFLEMKESNINGTVVEVGIKKPLQSIFIRKRALRKLQMDQQTNVRSIGPPIQMEAL